MNRADRQRWVAARTLADLGELMALWLEGKIESRPGYYGPTDLDSPSLTTLCAALCRAGFLTDNSQQGGHWEHDGRKVRARDALDGFCDDVALSRLHDAITGTGMIVSAHKTRRRHWWQRGVDDRVPVTEVNGRTYTAFGGTMRPSDLDGIWDGVSCDAVRAVRDAWHVAIVDPEWGRTDLLIPTLTSRLLAGAR